MDLNLDLDKRLKESISDLDFEKYLSHKVKKHIYKYADLEHYKLNQLFLKQVDYIIVLIESDPNFGHWCVLTKDSFNKEMTWFDPYGIRPTGELIWNTAKKNRELDNERHDILDLLEEANKLGYNIVYNKKRFQSSKPDINTCGRHCIFFLLCFFKKYMSLSDYIYYMEKLEKYYNTDADHIVTYFIQ
jgi:hypothetical protein